MKPTTSRALVGYFVFALAACSTTTDSTSSTSSTSAGIPGVSSTTLTIAPPSAPGSTTTVPPASEPASPLDAFFGNSVPVSGSSEDDAAMQKAMQDYQNALAKCMKDQGFDYVPFVLPLQFSFRREGSGVEISGAGSAPSIPPDQFAKQYGYGISTMDKSASTAPADPNNALVDAMSPAERVAYYHALYGPDVAFQKDGHLAHKELNIDDSSCFHQADVDSGGDQTTATTNPAINAFAPLRDEMGSLTDRELADARMGAAMQAWTDCMAAAGHPGYTDLNQGRQDVADRATKVMGEARDPSKADPDELAALRAYEISVATADLQCRVAYDAAFKTVQVDVEQAFIDAHRAELEQYRDALATSPAGG